MERQDIEKSIVDLANVINYVKPINMVVINKETAKMAVIFSRPISMSEITEISDYATASTTHEEIIDLQSAFEGENLSKTIKGNGQTLYFDIKSPDIKDKVFEFENGDQFEQGGSIKESKAKFSVDPMIERFMEGLTYFGSLYRNPFNPREFVFMDAVTISFDRFDMPNDKKAIRLNDLMSLEKGQGNGNKAMQAVTATADRFGFEILLDAKPFGSDSKALSRQKLADFYMKHGFVIDHTQYGWKDTDKGYMNNYLKDKTSGLFMIRKPTY
jgi:hypothetical protein